MTYIKPEPETNQSSTAVRETLELGLTAAQQQNWSLVNYYLKLLPQSQSHKRGNTMLLTGDDWQQGLNLATLVLIKADFQQRWEVQKLLPSFGNQIVALMLELLQDETIESEARWFICQVLANFPEPKVIVALIKLLQQTPEPELKEAAAQTLSAIGKTAVDALETLLDHPETRPIAVQSLFYIRTPETITPLLGVTQDREPLLRASAIKALGSFHDPRIPPVLLAALEDKASKVRQEAVAALGFRPDLCDTLNLVAHLRPLLQDFALEVCCQTAISLGRMQHPSAVTTMFEVLEVDTTPIDLKLELVKALGWSKIPQGIDYLGQALMTATEIVAQEIIVTLGRVTPPNLKPQAAQVLVTWWNNHQPEFPQQRQALATALGELRADCAREILLQLSTDSDRKVQLYAQSALKKLV